MGEKMGDFTQKSVVKSATRDLATKIADYTTFNALIQDILANNPWGCTAYESASMAKPAMEKSKEAYAASIVYENSEAKQVGSIPVRGPTMAAVNTADHADHREMRLSQPPWEPGYQHPVTVLETPSVAP